MSVHRVKRVSWVVALVAGLLALVWMVAWALWLLPDRPALAVMVYFSLAGIALAGAITGAACAIADRTSLAFAAGYRTGVASVWPNDAETLAPASGDPILQLVPQQSEHHQ